MIFDFIYYSIYLLCLLLSFKASPSQIKGLKCLRSLLVIGLVNEIISTSLNLLGMDNNYSHYLYIPIEYFIMCWFYILNTEIYKLKLIIKFSIPFYCISALLLGLFFHHFKGFPSTIYILEGLLQTIWIILILFNLPLQQIDNITMPPIFWILCSTLLFYTGILTFTSTYTYLQQHTKIAQIVRDLINVVLNCFLYLIWSFSFIKASVASKKQLIVNKN